MMLSKIFVLFLSKAQLKKCEKLFNIGISEIIIHGLGAAIKRACNLALQLKEIHHNSLDLDIKTSTEELIGTYYIRLYLEFIIST